MPTPHAEQKVEACPDPASEKRANWGRRSLTTVLPLVAVTVAAVFSIAPLRETLSWASRGRPESHQILSELNTALDQVYRSFELDDEAATYDRIAQRVTGDAVRDIYLEVRRSLLDEDGGRVSIDRVRVGVLDRIEWQSDGECWVNATWSVRGTVGHFGHSHERQNRYRARVKLLSQAGVWKIGSIQITEQERER